jgi:anti-sigma factor RsiW
MTHEQAQSLLDAWLDNELDPATALALEAHVHDCPACRAWLAQRRALLAQLRAAAVRYPVPAELSARITAQLGAARQPADARARPARQVQWFGALAAGLIVAIGGFLLGRSWPRAPDLRAELVSASVRAVLSAHPIDVLSSDHHTVKPWLSAQLPFSPPVPELAAAGDALLGGRVDYLGSMRVAALVYQRGHHQINVYVWPQGAMRIDSGLDLQADGYHLMSTRAGSFAVAMVSDLSAPELAQFRDRWRAEALAASAAEPAAGEH